MYTPPPTVPGTPTKMWSPANPAAGGLPGRERRRQPGADRPAVALLPEAVEALAQPDDQRVEPLVREQDVGAEPEGEPRDARLVRRREARSATSSGAGREHDRGRPADAVGRVARQRLALPHLAAQLRRGSAAANAGIPRGHPVHSGDISRASACHSCSDRTSPARLRSAMIASQAAEAAGQRRGVGHPVLQRRPPDGVVVLLGELAERRVDEQLDLARHQQVDRVGPALVHLEHPLGGNAAGAEVPRGALGGEDPEAEPVEPPRDRHHVGLVVIVDRDEDRARQRQRAVGGDLRLGERHPERVGDAHHLAGRAHLRAEDQVDALQLAEGEHRLLHRDVGLEHVVVQAELVERLARS